MVIKNIQNMISECITYADEIQNNPNIYPSDSKMQLKDLLRYDMMIFLGYLYEPGNPHFTDQMEYIKTNLRMILSEDKFLALVETKCADTRFLTEAPKSLSYFIAADRDTEMNKVAASVARSKFVVDAFRKLGEGFIAYDGAKDATKQSLKDYVTVLNGTLNSAGIVTSQQTSVLKSQDMPDYMKGTATFSNTANPDLETITSFDEKTGEFVSKKAIGISGRNHICNRYFNSQWHSLMIRVIFVILIQEKALLELVRIHNIIQRYRGSKKIIREIGTFEKIRKLIIFQGLIQSRLILFFRYSTVLDRHFIKFRLEIVKDFFHRLFF